MPTKKWLSKHQLVTFHLPNRVYEEFAAACTRHHLMQSEVLREAVDIMLTKDSETGGRDAS